MKKEPKLKFKSEEDRNLAIEEFTNLRHHPAWVRIIGYYQKKVEYIDEVLRGEIKNDDGTPLIKDLHDLELWQKRRNMAIQFMNLPDILTEFIERSEGMNVNFDPYQPKSS